MSDIFENDIDDENTDLSALEDKEGTSSNFSKEIKFPPNLYKLMLEYSNESIYGTSPEGLSLNQGDYVVIPTRYGQDLALVKGMAKCPIGTKLEDIVEITSKANEHTLEKAKALREKEEQAYKVFQEKVALHNLEMKLISVHFLLEEQKALFFFSAENRVDFRDLVKDLVSIFKMRIELRQVGVRDESRITGGLGVCGRPYCCNSVSDKLKPVSIRMAKDQNLSLNSTKISGQCGRLLCCLSYEYDFYAEARTRLPSEGLHVFYDGTNFRIIEVNPLTSMVKMIGDDGRLIEVNASRFRRDGNQWRIIN